MAYFEILKNMIKNLLAQLKLVLLIMYSGPHEGLVLGRSLLPNPQLPKSAATILYYTIKWCKQCTQSVLCIREFPKVFSI